MKESSPSTSRRRLTPEVKKLQALARSWGGDIRTISDEDFDALTEEGGFYEAPFAGYKLGVDWPKRHVLSVRAPRWPDVIHELGHLFATKDDPIKADEYGFFGWEYRLAVFIGGNLRTWVKNNHHYMVNDGEFGDFGELPPKRREQLLLERVQAAQALGIVTAEGVPLALPKP